MEAIAQLPGVAVVDWCDRAAAALTRMHIPSAAMVTVCNVDARGTVLARENVGAAWCGAIRAEDSAAAGTPPSPIALDVIRESVTLGEWIGWEFRPPAGSEASLDVIKPVPAVSRRAATGLNRRWDSLANCELLVAAVTIPESAPGRCLLAEVAMVNCPAEAMARCREVLAVTAPRIATAYLNALGPVQADKHSWLTAREEVILWKLVSGKKVPQIAEELHRSIYTVHDHVKSLHRKLGASNRGQLVARALGHLGPLIIQDAQEADEGDDDASSLTPPPAHNPVGNGHAARQPHHEN